MFSILTIICLSTHISFVYALFIGIIYVVAGMKFHHHHFLHTTSSKKKKALTSLIFKDTKKTRMTYHISNNLYLKGKLE